MTTLHDGYFTDGLDADPELASAIRGELGRQQDGIELIASARRKTTSGSPRSAKKSARSAAASQIYP